MRKGPFRRTAGAALTAAAVLLAVTDAPGTAASGTAPATYPEPGLVRGDVVVHDPSMIRTGDGTYYVFSTHNGIEMRSSVNRTDFARADPAFPDGVPWAADFTGGDTHELWAPDVSRHGGRYYLYISASSFGSNHSAIGLAVSTSAKPGTWQDQGIVYSSESGGDFNAIDPSLTVDRGGKWWLVFGSWWSGIKMIQIDPATGKQLASNPTRYNVARRTSDALGIEGPFIFRHGKYYYMFTSWDLCCRGVDSTYKIMVGRSASITGPYVDRAGTALSAGGGTEVLSSHGSRVIGPGGQTVLTDGDQDLLVYHYYDATDNGTPKLGLNPLGFDSAGWPYVH